MASRKKIVYVTQPPEGLFYLPNFITAQEENSILEHVQAQDFEPYDHHGYRANREVVYFGLSEGYNFGATEVQTEPMPDWIIPLRERFSNLMALRADELAMALVARYKVGAGIGWHRDRPQFGPSVLGLSLASDAEMRFRRFVEDTEEMYKINLERRSAYIIGGVARSVWQHGMNPVKKLRYSITFRTVKDKQNVSSDPRHVPENIAEHLRSVGVNFGEHSQINVQSNQLKLSL